MLQISVTDAVSGKAGVHLEELMKLASVKARPASIKPCTSVCMLASLRQTTQAQGTSLGILRRPAESRALTPLFFKFSDGSSEDELLNVKNLVEARSVYCILIFHA